LLGKAARFKGNSGWFKSVTVMERAAREVIGPDFPTAADSAIANFIDTVFQWVEDGGR
jgi:hypothetical protein